MMNEQQQERFKALRKMVTGAIEAMAKSGEPGKSYEGAWETHVLYPGYYDDYGALPTFMIELHCYLIGPSRHYKWAGSTWEGVLDRCERDVREWVKEAFDDVSNNT